MKNEVTMMITGISLFIFIIALFGTMCAIIFISDTIASIISKEHKFEIAFIIAIFFICVAIGILSECAGSGLRI